MRINVHCKDKTYMGEIDSIDYVYDDHFEVEIIWNRINKVITKGYGKTLSDAIKEASGKQLK